MLRSKIVTCHIGNGASVTAVLDGKSFDTSMGFSPLDGLVMGTRCGAGGRQRRSRYIGAKEGMTYAELNEMMNKRSGVLGHHGSVERHARHRPRLRRGRSRARSWPATCTTAGSRSSSEQYAAEMGGVDLIVFTGGVGENSARDARIGLRRTRIHGREVRPRGQRRARAAWTSCSRRPTSRVKVASDRHRRRADDRHGHLQSGEIKRTHDNKSNDTKL